MYTVRELFDLERTLAGAYLAQFSYPWQALARIGQMLCELGSTLPAGEYTQALPRVWVHKSAEIAPSACLEGPCIIGPDTQLRHCAYLRGNVLAGAGCVIGNSVEVKNAILFDGVQVPHFNYVGDSILGCRAHLGAGAVTSNVKSDRSPVVLRRGDREMATGLKKCGAMVGDFAEVGCNSVLNPGTVLGRNSTVYPLSCVRGTLEEGCIFKSGGVTVKKEKI